MMSQCEICKLIFDDVSQVYLKFGKFTESGKPQVRWFGMKKTGPNLWWERLIANTWPPGRWWLEWATYVRSHWSYCITALGSNTYHVAVQFLILHLLQWVCNSSSQSNQVMAHSLWKLYSFFSHPRNHWRFHDWLQMKVIKVKSLAGVEETS